MTSIDIDRGAIGLRQFREASQNALTLLGFGEMRSSTATTGLLAAQGHWVEGYFGELAAGEGELWQDRFPESRFGGVSGHYVVQIGRGRGQREALLLVHLDRECGDRFQIEHEVAE